MVFRFYFLVLLWFPGYVGAQTLFVQSSPPGSALYVDGILQKGKTPLLLRSLSPGPHGLKLARSGYISQEKTLILEKDKAVEIRFELPRSHGVLAFPDAMDSGSGKLDPRRLNFLFPTGSYTLSIVNGKTQMETTVITKPTSALPGMVLTLTLGAAAASTWWDLTHPPPGSELPLSGATLGTYALGLGALLWIIAGNQPLPEPPPLEIFQEPRLLAASEVEMRIRKGDTALGAGKLALAEETFLALLQEDSLGEKVPLILYRLARLHSVQGRIDLATAEYRLLVEVYPQMEFYDRWVKALSDLEKSRGRKKQAAEALDLLIYHDPLFNPAEVALWKKQLDETK